MDRPRVLVVDPDAEAQALVRKVLGRHCDLIVHDDPLLLWDALELFEPDLVIMELDLPCLSGFELIHLMQSDPAMRHIPIMVYSAQHGVEDQKLAYRLGATHFQAKPARPSQLFKGAAMFVRLMSHPRPPKRLAAEEVLRQLDALRAEGRIHPVIEQAIAAGRHQRQATPCPERSVLATVAGKRPAG